MRISSIQQFISKEAFSGVLLFMATVLAVVVANSSLTDSYNALWQMPLGLHFGETNIEMTLKYWINDALMALFFLLVGLEIKREMVIGELSTFQKASFPVVAAVGGMVLPALIYVGFNPDNPMGFGVPMATDIAFALGILMLLGSRVNPSLKVFLVALAVVDDLGAILVVATVYTSEIHAIYFLYAGITYALIWTLNIKGVRKLWPYLILGIALWYFVHAIGVHATIAGVLLAFAIPIGSKIDEREFVDDSRESINKFEANMDTIPVLNNDQIDELEKVAHNSIRVRSPLVRLEHTLHGYSAYFIMPIFAFANAGVIIDFSTMSTHLTIVLGVMLGLVLGKPIGIFGMVYVATKLKILKKPDNISWGEILAAGFLGGIGFTMSIFITQLAFMDAALIAAVKLAIFIASFIAAVAGVILILRSAKARESAS